MSFEIPRTKIALSGVMLLLLAGSCVDPGDEGTIDEQPRLGEIAEEFTVNESGNNNSPPTLVDPLKAVDDGIGVIDFAGDTDWWYSIAHPSDRVFVYVDATGSATSTDSFVDVYGDADLVNPLASDDDDGVGTSAAIGGAVVPAGNDLLYIDVSEFADNDTINDYEIYSYVADPNDVHVEAEGNDTLATAETILNPLVSGSLAAADVDYYAFNANAGDTIVAILDNDPDGNGNADTDITIRDSGDAVLSTGDNDGDDSNAAGAVVAAATGTYYLRIDAGSTGNYDAVVLVAGRPPVPLGTHSELILNDTLGTAEPLKGHTVGLATLAVTTDFDYWHLIGDVGDIVFAYVDTQQAAGSTDSVLSVRNASDVEIDGDDDGGPADSSVVAGAVTQSEDTYLRIFEFAQDETMGDYHLFAVIANPGDLHTEPGADDNDTIATADPITATRVRAEFSDAADIDIFSVTAREGDNIVVMIDDNPDGTEVDTHVTIRDAMDVILATGDNTDNDSNAAGPIEARADGTYYVHIENGGAVNDHYEFVALVTNGPVDCGDNDLDGVEVCDDGNAIDNDDCTNNCEVATCGDGVLHNQGTGTEECDDGNAIDNDDCTNNCEIATCGDGIIHNQGTGTEECDDTNAVDNDDCTNACANATCGDGIVHNQGTGTEECDDNNANNNDDCIDTCENAVCGDGHVHNEGAGTEECDDSNTTPGDGCDATCMQESMGTGGMGSGGMGSGGMGSGGMGTGGMGTGATGMGGTGTGATGMGGMGTGNDGTGNNSASDDEGDTAAEGGCGCHVVGNSAPSNTGYGFGAFALMGLGLMRRRRYSQRS